MSKALQGKRSVVGQKKSVAAQKKSTTEVVGDEEELETVESKIIEVPKRVPLDDIIDDFDYSYIPDSLKDLLCGPAGFEEDEFSTKRKGKSSAMYVRRGKFKRKKQTALEDDDDEEEDEDEDEDESEYDSSGGSEITEDENPFIYNEEDSDISSEDEESKKKRRYLIGKDSFQDLEDPNLDGALDSTEEEDEEEEEEAEEIVHRSRRQQERDEYKELCKELGILPLRRFLKSMHTDTVDLRCYQLTPEEIIAICKTMENNTHVKTIDLSGNYAGPEGGKAIAKMLENNYTLTNVNIAAMGILPVFDAICEAVSLNITLESLDISQNDLKDNEMKSVGKMLKEATMLQHLNLSRNKIRDPGALILGQALRENKGLISLNLAFNQLKGEKQCIPLFQSLAEHPALEKLDLSYNTLQDKIAKGLRYLMANNKQLQYLNISRNVFENAGAAIIGNGLRNSANMVEFIAGPNEWNHEGSAAILRALLNEKASPTLATIDFGWRHDVYKNYLQVEEKVKNRRPDLNIIRGDSFGLAKAKDPDIQALVIHRAKIVCENFATPLDMLMDELRKEPATMTPKQFKKFIRSCNLYKDKKLTDAFIRNFPGPGPLDVDCKKILEVYDREFPKVAKKQEHSTERPPSLQPQAIITLPKPRGSSIPMAW